MVYIIIRFQRGRRSIKESQASSQDVLFHGAAFRQAVGNSFMNQFDADTMFVMLNTVYALQKVA